jgi:hypothetical protein
VIVVTALLIVRSLIRVSRTRNAVLEEVRRRLRGGVIEKLPRRGPQARGRIGELEVTVDLYRDPQRPDVSPLWRVMAVGPVRVPGPVEAHVGGWRGWIDPWMQMSKALPVPDGAGPHLVLHGDQPLALDHPVLVALRRQGHGIGAGGLHVQSDFMRAELRFDRNTEGNRGLFGFLQAMTEIAGRQPGHASIRTMRVETREEE